MLSRRFSMVGSLLFLTCLVTALLVAQAGDAAGPEQGPVAAYSFDEGTGTTAADVTGDGHTATIEGARWARGRYGDGLEFKGSEHNVVKIPASSELNFEEEFTLEAWVRPTSSTDKLAPIVGKTTGGGSGSKSLSYYLYAGNSESRPYGEVQHVLGTGKKVTATSAPPGATWTHLALTYDGAVERLYVNGVQVAETAAEAPVTTTGELQIGAETEHSEYFSGRIDEVRIYNRVLNGGEVDADMETPIQTPRSGPVAAYSFDEGTGTTVADVTGHGHTATIEGAKWTDGRYGDGLEFKGSEHNVVKIPASSELNLEEEFTLEAWVRPASSTDKLAPIVGKTTGGGSGSKSLSYYLYAGNSESRPYGEIQHTLGTGKKATATSAPPGATWTHLALTYDGAAERLYVNGVQVAETATEAPVTTSGELQIGAETEHSEWFSGRIDEVRIYNRVLNGAEVGSDMEAPLITPKQGPVAAYSFDEGAPGVTTVQDVTGDGHTATIEDGEWTTQGRYGGAISFDGSGGNKCVSVPDSPELRFSEEFTLEAWVRPVGGSYEDPVVVKEASGKDAFGLGLGSREEYEAEGFIGEGKGSKAAVGGEKVREYEWVHLAATWDGSKIRLYVEGELADTETATSPPATGEGSLKIGCDGPDGQFTGQIDEVRVYNRTLTGGEVAADMESPLQTPRATPVASYSFDEKNEETATDTTGDGHTATVEGARWTEHGRYGGAMEFDAAEEDVLRIPASPELDLGGEFTLEAWVRPSGADNHQAPLIDKQEGGGHGYFLYEGGSVSDRPYGAAAEEQELIHAEESLPPGAWSHVALTFDGNRTHLYVDGEEVRNGSAEPTITSEGELEIGGSTDTADWFDGRIDEVRIYNRGLEPAEVEADMEAPIQTPKQGPVAAWSFDQGEGGTAEDWTGDGHTATIEGAEWAIGKYGDALKFNGTSSCVSIADTGDLRLGEEFTVESWVRPEGELKHDPVIFKEGSGHLNYALEIGRVSMGKAEGAIGTSTSPNHKEATSEHSLEANVWNHLATTFDGSTLRLYVNGVLVDTETVAGADSAREGALKIGCDSQYGEHFRGRIDDARVYDRVLSAGEIREDERFDLLPPDILLAGPATEPLPESEEEGEGVALDITATDGSKVRDQSGLHKVTVAVNGQVEAVYEQHCPRYNCSLSKTWTYEPSKYTAPRNSLTVTAEDQQGNVSSETIFVSAPLAAGRSCNQAESGPLRAFETESLPGGGVNYVVHRGGIVEETPYPPEGFDPLEASEAELEEYGLPPRPAPGEEAELEEWTEMMEHWGYESPKPPDACVTERVTSGVIGAAIGGSAVHNPIWSGYVATSPGVDLGYDKASARFAQATSYPTSCAGSEMVSWVGVGGRSYGEREAPLIQAGTIIDDDNHIRAFWDIRGSNGGGTDIEKLKRDEFEVNSKDDVSVSAEWAGLGRSRIIFRWFDHETHSHHVKRLGGEEAHKRFYDPDTADFIVEAPPKNSGASTPLKQFKHMTFRRARARKVNEKSTILGEDFPEELDMYRNGVDLASPEGLFEPGVEYTNVWHNCDG